MKNAIVFGATGQLGCYSALALKENGYNVFAIGRRASDGGFFATKGISFIGGVDVSDISTFSKLPKGKIDVVVNMAGTMPAHADRDMMPYVQCIVVGTVNVCNWMKTVDCQRIIFNTTPSDTAEYWGTTTPIDDDVVRSFPKNGNDHAVYAICKRAATDILEHLQICGEVKPCVFRHFMVYGWHPDATYYLEGKEKILPWRSMIRKCIQGEPLEVYGDVTRKKELLYIKDFARAVVIAANNDACGIFNLPGYEPYSLDSMVDGIINAFSDGRTVKKYRPDMPDTLRMNILILSAGTRNKVVQYFVKTLDGKGKVIATDMSNLAPAIYDADKYYIVPRMTEEGYIDVILDICKKEKISGVLSLIDPELSLLAENKENFEAVGTKVIGSSYELCEMSLDKYTMYNWLTDHRYKCAKSYMNKDEFFADVESGKAKYPVFVKPAKGSASIAISKVYDKETIDLLFAHDEGLMVQEFLDGQEIGADVYIDMISGEVVSIFTKKKLKMRAGETDKSVSFKDDKLFSLIEKFVKEAGYRGQIDIDIFDINGEYYISEVNPRFGGGYPHAYESGADHMKLIVNNLEGNVNKRVIGSNYKSETYMMKYNEVMCKL